MTQGEGDVRVDRHARILEAAVSLLGREGIAGVSMRAVAREAGVALGLVNYHFKDKNGLVSAALRQVESQDLAMVESDPSADPRTDLGVALRRFAAPELLTTDYLSLRLQLWSLAQANADFEQINSGAQHRYRAAIADLIARARPDLAPAERARRAADIDVVQNGVWLTALLGLDQDSIERAVRRCEEIALSP